MIDIVSLTTGLDMGVYDTQVEKAGNILSIQLGSLEYAPDLGIDMDFFLSEDFRFQNESFKAYCIEVLSRNGISVGSLDDSLEALYANYVFKIQPDESSTGLIAR